MPSRKGHPVARNNAILNNSPAFRNAGGYAPAPEYNQAPGTQQQWGQPQQQWGQPQQQAPGYQAPQSQQGGYSPADLEAMYNRPAATGFDTGRMTWRNTMNAITATFGVIIAVAFVIMMLPTVTALVMGTEEGRQIGFAFASIAAIVGAIGSFVTVLVNAFKKTPSMWVTLAYAVFEGLLLGGISLFFETVYPGIVLQAVIGTLAVAGSITVLFRMGKLRTSPKLTKMFLIAFGAYFVFTLVNLVLVLLGVTNLRTGMLGVVIGLVAVALASYSLVMDLEVIRNGVDSGAPNAYAWTAALGLAVTVVWMYTEILRILAILRDN